MANFHEQLGAARAAPLCLIQNGLRSVKTAVSALDPSQALDANATTALAVNATTALIATVGSPFLHLPHHPHHEDPTIRHPFWMMEWGLVEFWPAVWCSLALFLSGVLCAAAGIGGGGIYVVVLMLCGLLSPYDAVPLSKAVVFFGSLSTLFLNLVRMKSDKTDKKEKVIDFNTVRVVAPAALGGTFLGVLLNWHSSGAGIVLMLAAILIFMTLSVSRTAYKQYCQEEEELVAAAEAAAPPPSADVSAGPPPAGEALVAQEVSEDAKAFTRMDLALSVGCEVVVILCGALRFHMSTCHDQLNGIGIEGSCQHPLVEFFFGSGFTEIMAHETKSYVLAMALAVTPLTLCLILCVMFGHRATVCKGSEWRPVDVVTYQTMGIFTGCFAGLVGVGGGLVFSPFFLVMGLDPAAAVATSSTCVLYTSSSTTFQYILSDRVVISLALIYGLVTTIASYLGTSCVHILQDTFQGRRSYVTMIVVVAVGLSAVLSLVKVYNIMHTPVIS